MTRGSRHCEANEAEAAAQGAGAGLEGRFRVSVPVTFSRVHLVRELGSFLDAHPEYRGEQGHRLRVARQLAASGCTVLVGSRNKARGDEAAAKLKSEGGEVGHLEIDLEDAATIASAAQSNTDFGHLDILLSNAGVVGLGDPLPSGSSLDGIERASAQTS